MRLLQVLCIGLATGFGFVLPILAMRFLPAGQGRTIGLLVALGLAILLIRRLGRLLHRLLDATDRPLRFPLLALYAAMAMAPPVSLLLLPGRAG